MLENVGSVRILNSTRFYLEFFLCDARAKDQNSLEFW